MTEDDTFEALQLRVEISGRGTKRYFNSNNELHRVFGPAAVYAGGSKLWYLNGKYHRVDGPAIEFASGVKMFWINGLGLTEQEFLKHPLCTIK